MPVDLPELSAQDHALLAQFRERESPSEAIADRVQRRVRARLADEERAPSFVSRWTMWLRAGGLTVAIAAAVLLVVAGSTRLIARLSVEPSAPSAASDTTQRPRNDGLATPHVEPLPEIAEPPRQPLTVPEPPAALESAEWPGVADALDPSHRDRPRVGKPTTTPAPAPIDAAAEIQLVASAKAEKDPQARLELIRKHGREFAGGKLGREVAILEIQTLCTLGRRDDARARATAFVEKNPGSAYADIAARACEAR